LIQKSIIEIVINLYIIKYIFLIIGFLINRCEYILFSKLISLLYKS